MMLTEQIAKHFRGVFFGGNWTDSNLKDHLKDLDWQQARTKIDSVHTIAELVYHIHYFVSAVLHVLEGNPLDAHDKFSFDCPPVQSREDWERMVEKILSDAERFASLVEQMPENRLWKNFSGEKYGSFYSNLQGIIEHSHYHLGQIVLLKKMIQQQQPVIIKESKQA